MIAADIYVDYITLKRYELDERSFRFTVASSGFLK